MGGRIDKRPNAFMYALSSLRPTVAFPPLGGGHGKIIAAYKIVRCGRFVNRPYAQILNVVRYSLIFNGCSASYTSSDGIRRHLPLKGKALERDFFLRKTTFVENAGSRWPLRSCGSTFGAVRKHSHLCPQSRCGAVYKQLYLS